MLDDERGASTFARMTTPLFETLERIELLENLTDGWLDGVGRRMQLASLAGARELCAELWREHLPLPLIEPTPAGTLLLVWALEGATVSAESTDHRFVVFMHDDERSASAEHPRATPQELVLILRTLCEALAPLDPSV